jgi:hypothetical protein
MAYAVRIASRAERDLASLYGKITLLIPPPPGRGIDVSNKLSLAKTPNRCPVTPENKSLRHLLYGK